jgi:indolepyruvate ferredoxin oxidoreductase beta subunit
MGGRFLFLNVLLLGAMGGARVSDITPEELREAIEALSPEKFRKVYLDVLELGRAFFGP